MSMRPESWRRIILLHFIYKDTGVDFITKYSNLRGHSLFDLSIA